MLALVDASDTSADRESDHPWWPPDPDTIALPIVCKPSPFLWFAAALFGLMAPLCFCIGLFLQWIDPTAPWPLELRIPFIVIGGLITWVFVTLRIFLRTTTLDRSGVSIRSWLGGAETRLRWDDVRFLDLGLTHQSSTLEFGDDLARRQGLSASFHLGFRDAVAGFRAFVVPRLAYDVAERIAVGDAVTFPQWTPLTLERTKRRPPKHFLRVDSRGIEARLIRRSLELAWSDVTGYVVLSEHAGILTSPKGEIPIDATISNGLALLAILPALLAAYGIEQDGAARSS